MADIDNLTIQITASATTAINAINSLSQALDGLNSKLGALNTSGVDKVAQSASKLGSVARSISQVGNQMGNIGNNSAGIAKIEDAATGASRAINNISKGTDSAARSMQELSTTSKSSASGIQQVSEACKNVANNTSKSAINLRSFSSASKTASKNANKLFKELTRVSKMLKLMITRMILRKIIQGVLDGFKNLAQYSSQFDATLSLLWNDFKQLGNSIAATVAPLLNALAPAIDYIIQLFIKAINVINQFISAFAGLSTWTRAKKLTDDYAKSLENSNKAAKALKKTVLGFDEINQLQANTDSGSSGTNPKDMFEEVPIDPKILKYIDDLKKKVGELKKYWDAFTDGFKLGLGDDWKQKVDLIKDGLLRIKNALKDIWTDPEVTQARDRYFTTLAQTLGTVAGTVVRIGLNIGANLAQGIAKALENKSPEIKKYLAEMFDIGTEMNEQVGIFAKAIGEISDVLTGDNAVAATTAFTELFIEAFMLISENAAKFGKSFIKLVTQPIIDNKVLIKKTLDTIAKDIADFVGTIQGVVGDIRGIFSDTWTKHLSPMFESLTRGLSNLLKLLLDGWNQYIQPVITKINGKLQEFWDGYGKPIFDNVVQAIGTAGHLLAMFFENIFVPYVGQIINNYGPAIQAILSALVDVANILAKAFSVAFEQMTFNIRSFLEFLETGFTKGWDKAWSDLEKSTSKHWDGMLKKIKDVLNSICNLVEKVVNGIAKSINQIGEKIGDSLNNVELPSWLGGGSLNIHIPHLSENIHLPRFATGGFPENGLFLANSTEMVGRFSNGKTAVANNAQITEGIAKAVYSAMVSANSSGGGNVPIYTTIQIGEEEIARAVTNGQRRLDRRFSPTTT